MSEYLDETFDDMLPDYLNPNYNDEDDSWLAHEGRGHDDMTEDGDAGQSGRFPYGSGRVPYQHADSFLKDVEKHRYEYKDKPYVDQYGRKYTGDQAVVHIMGLENVAELKTQISLAKQEQKEEEYAKAYKLIDEKDEDGEPKYNTSQIARMLGYPHESSVRNIIVYREKAREKEVQPVIDGLKKQLDEGTGMIDIGKDAHLRMNCTKTRFDQAIYILKTQGYHKWLVKVKQSGASGQYTDTMVLARPDKEYKESHDYGDIEIAGFKYDKNTNTIKKPFERPVSIDSKRILIKYADDKDSGSPKDGLVEIRRGVPDLDLGGSHYCQVRIAVDDKYYIKGMACYSDNVPDGYDLIVNSSKSSKKGIEGSLKALKMVGETDDHKPDKGTPIDWDNPFKSNIMPGVYDPTDPDTPTHTGQSFYIDPKTGEKKLSAINKRSDEGDWEEWGKKLPAQFLSKQPIEMIKKQLQISTQEKDEEYKELMSLTNPTIKKKLLMKFAESCDTGASTLKAARLPGSRYQVVLPAPSLKDGECYAPNYENGTRVALIRFPHAGTFEIPYLTVNNNNKEAKALYSTEAKDVIAINPKAAAQLSGADFDGDTALVIPCNEHQDVDHRPYLKELEGWDNKVAYPPKYELDANGNIVKDKNGDPIIVSSRMGKGLTQTEMGKITNLIMDMTLADATDEDLAKAVKHSMVVIDAYKHKLDYKLSEKENEIAKLKKKYQSHTVYDEETGKTRESTGAGTIVTQAGKKIAVTKHQGDAKINPETGELVYKPQDDENRYYYKVKVQTQRMVDGKPVFYANGNPRIKTDWVGTYLDKDGRLFRYGKDLLDENGNPIKTAKGRFAKEKIYVTDEDELKRFERTEDRPMMSLTNDAFTLVRGNPKEVLYAEYANHLKALANKSRLEVLKKDENPKDPEAAEKYKNEVNSLDSQLNNAKMNAPLERMAQRRAREIFEAQLADDPYMDEAYKKKLEQRAITKARAELGAHRVTIKISPKEWEAIQAHAISKSKLEDIMKYVDNAELLHLALPKTEAKLSKSQRQSMEAMFMKGKYTNAQIAEHFGISVSTVIKYRNGEMEDD